ncbi:hypothetical protein GSB9_02478 [Flavobacteriaceae bacterium GSB9]|nr:hypothetical protein GSB9_02478 [Flavobacteriaceae bacterium GSB9]
MVLRSLILFLFVLLFTQTSFCQQTYDIDFSGKDRDKKCKSCIKAFSQKPKEVKYAISRKDNGLYFEVNDKDWFGSVFKNEDDGLAVDVILKNRYDCSLENLPKSQVKGLLLKPVYSNTLKSNLKEVEEGLFKVKIGEIPKDILVGNENELEYNILFIGNKTLCRYYVTYNLDFYSRDLLDTGMYLDELTYGVKQIKSSEQQEFTTSSKTLKFIVPFKKNKSSYSQADIKPIYDSLRLSNYNVNILKIKAYSSIEGISSRNHELQEQRAKSITKAIQGFQIPTIQTEVSTSENWVEFFKDIEGTKYEALKSLTKNEIRAKIAGSMSREMEHIFKNHRKAVVEMGLVNKELDQGKSVNELLYEFNKAVEGENLDKANKLQTSIFNRINTKEAPLSVLENMEIPKQKQFVKLLNKNSAFKYIFDERLGLIVYNELLDIEKLDSENADILYNLTALKIFLWRYNAIDVNESDLMREIKALKKNGVPNALTLRLMINFHIVRAENLMELRDYEEKDKSVDFINENYKKIALSDYDYFSLAQFFSYYAHSDLAEQLLKNKVRSIDTDENLLFYYLNLTLINKDLTEKPNYRLIMLNARNINKERFCKLFNSVEKDGITFQLLDNVYLRKTYCENCNN